MCPSIKMKFWNICGNFNFGAEINSHKCFPYKVHYVLLISHNFPFNRKCIKVKELKSRLTGSLTHSHTGRKIILYIRSPKCPFPTLVSWLYIVLPISKAQWRARQKISGVLSEGLGKPSEKNLDQASMKKKNQSWNFGNGF